MIKRSQNQLHISHKKAYLTATIIDLFGFSGGLFLHPFLSYQALIAFGTLLLAVILLTLTLSQR